MSRFKSIPQDALDNHGTERLREVVRGADGVVRSHKRDHMASGYKSVFGAVRVARTGYSQRGVSSLFPRDAQLNLPARGYSHRLQKRVAAKAARLSFEAVAHDIETETGVRLGKAQIEQIVSDAAQDFDAFYNQPCSATLKQHTQTQPIQVLTGVMKITPPSVVCSSGKVVCFYSYWLDSKSRFFGHIPSP